MPRFTKTISVCSFWLALAVAPAIAQSQSDDDRVFGRVSPDRPVVEIPAEQIDGIAPSTPPQAWDVRDPSRVNAAQQIPAAPEKAETDTDSALAAIETPAITQSEAEPATQAEASPVVPYVPPAQAESSPRLLGTNNAQPALGDTAAAADKPWWQEMSQTLAALGIVLALIMVLAFVYTRLSRSSGSLMTSSGGKSPAGLIEVLARYPVGPRQTLMLLKFDRRVLLVTQTNPRGGPEQMTTLCELTDPEDVASVLVKVRDGAGDSMNDAFRAAMDRAGGVPASGPAASRTPAPEFMPEPTAASVAEPKPSFQTDYDPEDLRQTVGGTEEERAQLWEDMGTTPAGRDPIGALRRRLDSMRGGQPG
ncbi:MAG: flagellar biosynthetic protein FliO [Phycisphaerales bacterium]